MKEANLEPALERQMKQQMSWDISSIFQEHNRQLGVFSKSRHRGTILDKLRPAIGRNSPVIIGVATQYGNAALPVWESSLSIAVISRTKYR
jgi:hypothetical protein